MRAFIAIDVPRDIAVNAAKLQLELPQDSIKPVDPANMHLTLRFLGNDVKDEQVSRIKEIIASVKFEPFVVKCKSVGVFPNPHYVRAVWVGADSGGKIEEINREINRKLQEFEFEDEPFMSHITVSRVRKRVDLSDFVSKHANDSFGEFTVKENGIKLKRSIFTSNRPIHTTL